MESSHELSLQIAETEKEINLASNNRDQVKIAINALRREIHQKQIDIKNLEDSLLKAESIVRELKTKHSILKDKFWTTKEQGL